MTLISIGHRYINVLCGKLVDTLLLTTIFESTCLIVGVTLRSLHLSPLPVFGSGRRTETRLDKSLEWRLK